MLHFHSGGGEQGMGPGCNKSNASGPLLTLTSITVQLRMNAVQCLGSAHRQSQKGGRYKAWSELCKSIIIEYNLIRPNPNSIKF